MSKFGRRLQQAAANTAVAPPPPPPATGVTKVLVIMEENHSLSEMSSGMPYLYSLAMKYSYASAYKGITHPSLPNYLAIAGGSTFGVTDDNDPSTNAPKVGSAMSVFDQALAAGKTAKLYAESMTSNCELSGSGAYAVRHNPWAYFASYRSNANQFDVPMANNFQNDVAANNLPNAGMLIPNVNDDAHDGTLAAADSWLQTYLPGVLASNDFINGKLAVIVTADEDDSSQNNTVLTVVLHPSLSGSVVSTPLTHYSLTAYYAHVVGATPLLNGASAASFANAFGLS